MKAILEIGGKQILVEPGTVIRTEKLDQNVGDSFELDQVLCIFGDNRTIVGSPHVNGAKVKFSVKGETKGKKVYMRTYKRRKKYKRTLGHRQNYLELRVEDVIAG
jgi:large subunit ribosomal protein L21